MKDIIITTIAVLAFIGASIAIAALTPVWVSLGFILAGIVLNLFLTSYILADREKNDRQEMKNDGQA